MPYIGNTAANRFVAPKATTRLSGNGSTTAFTLEHAVGSDEDILVSVDGVIQEPSVAYAVSSGTTLTFTAAPSSGTNNIFVCYLFRTVGTVSHPSNNALTATTGTFTGAFTSLGIDDNADATAVTIDSAERVMIGTTTEGNSSADDLTIANSADTGITIRSGTSNSGSIYFSDATSGTGEYSGFINYAHSINALRLGTSSTTHLSISDDGAVTKPKQPSFLAVGQTQTNIAVGSDQTLQFATEVFDRNADYNNSNYTFTAPVEGLYHLNVQGYIREMDTASSYIQVAIRVSNRSIYWLIDPNLSADASYFPISISSLVDMDANDTAFVAYNQGTGAAQTQIDTGIYFTGYLVA